MDKNERVVLSSSVSPIHYKLELTPDHDALDFMGALDIEVVVSSSTSQVTLHSKEIFVISASYAAKDASGPELREVSAVGHIGFRHHDHFSFQINYNLKATTVTFAFASTLPLGNGILSIRYKGILNGDMAGYYKSSYVDADGQKKIMSSTQFEALDARRALP